MGIWELFCVFGAAVDKTLEHNICLRLLKWFAIWIGGYVVIFLLAVALGVDFL